MKKYRTVLKSEKEYENALQRLDEIFDVEPGSDEDKEADLLVLLIKKPF